MGYDLAGVLADFNLEGSPEVVGSFGSGHINDTLLVRCGRREYVLQRINHEIFRNPEAVMSNMERVCSHLRRQLEREGTGEADRRCLSLVTSRHGRPFSRDADGNTWRLMPRVERVRSFDNLESDEQAYEVGRAFGEFQGRLSDLGPPRLIETIPNFHHTPTRVAQLQAALEADRKGRAASVTAELEFALARAPLASRLVDLLAEGRLPERVTHNDTKLNNLLFDQDEPRALCVVDLDTVMPGLALYDFGDMVRTATATAAEDCPDPASMKADFPRFAALTRGYLAAARGFLVPAEIENLVLSGILMTYEVGIRFLADHLAGDTYFRIHRPDHNLDRARTQFRLVASLEEQRSQMEDLVASLASAPTAP